MSKSTLLVWIHADRSRPAEVSGLNPVDAIAHARDPTVLDENDSVNRIIGVVAVSMPGFDGRCILRLTTPEHRLWPHVIAKDNVGLWDVVRGRQLQEPFVGIPVGLGARRHRATAWRLSPLSIDDAARRRSGDDGMLVGELVRQWSQDLLEPGKQFDLPSIVVSLVGIPSI